MHKGGGAAGRGDVLDGGDAALPAGVAVGAGGALAVVSPTPRAAGISVNVSAATSGVMVWQAPSMLTTAVTRSGRRRAISMP